MKKLLSLSLMALGVLCLTRQAEASVVARMPKEVFVSTYTTGLVQVTPSVSSLAVTAAQYQPGAVYQVIQASGAASEYFAMYDSSSTASIVCGQAPPSPLQQLGPRLLFGSTTAETITTFDPPLIFHNGLVVCDSAVTGSASVTYELGRGLSGQ